VFLPDSGGSSGRSDTGNEKAITCEVIGKDGGSQYRPAMSAVRPVGDVFREWRQRRRLSQLELALKADVSARHLSFVETGRSQPSREMVLHLAEQLDIPLRERNGLLLAAGFAPAYTERPFQDPVLAGAREAVERVLAGHEPYPAIAVDRHWTLVAFNRAIAPLLSCVAPALQQPPINVLRNSLHPDGMASRIANLREWRAHIFARLRRQIDVTGDPTLADLLRELRDYPAPDGGEPIAADPGGASVVVPLRFVSPAGLLNLISTTMVFGTPLDITLSELALETFFPADPPTAAILAQLGEEREP
jgi:transcriptional regulator with XRE-family HTH domain